MPAPTGGPPGSPEGSAGRNPGRSGRCWSGVRPGWPGTRPAAGRDVARKIGRELQHQQRLLSVQGPPHFSRAAQGQQPGEGPGLGQALDQLERLRPAVLVQHRQRIVFHLECGGEREDGQLQQHRHDQQHPPLPVLQQGLQLLDNQLCDAMEHGSKLTSSRFRVLRAVRPINTAEAAARKRLLSRSTAQTSPAWKSVCIALTK